MKDLIVTYSTTLSPFIQTAPKALWINTYYCRNLPSDYLKNLLIEQGYDDITDVIVEQIIAFARIYNEEKDITLTFPLQDNARA
jgi:hypothetical protein